MEELNFELGQLMQVRGFIKSPMNYTGGKYKLLEHIIPLFPKNINNFVDLFCGGLNVGINVTANTIYANDQITYLCELYSYFKNSSISSLLRDIKNRISHFGLSQENESGYNNLRSEYNRERSILDLFLLSCYSFNHQIRFNSRHDFNMPFGRNRSSYNDSIENNLVNFCKALQRKNIVFSTGDYREFDFGGLSANDVVYCDPPYLISTGSYNDGKRGFQDWTEKEDMDLFRILDELDGRNIYFFLSNVLEHKGMKNDNLIEWSKKYRMIYLDKIYSNCSYHFKDRTTTTVEVLVTNYSEDKCESLR